MNLDLNKIKYFQAVVGAKSISKAAKACGISQPALSIMMKNLEAELGVKLIEKVGRQIQITEMGHLVAQKATELENWREQLNEEISQSQSPRGHIRIGTYENLTANVLPDFIPGFVSENPDIDFMYEYTFNDGILEGIKNSRFDVGLLSLLTPEVTYGLDATLLFESEMHLVAAPSLKMPKSLALKELKNYPFVSFRPDTDEDFQDFLDIFGKHISKSKVNVATENLLTVREHVLRGLGYSCLPTFLVQEQLKNKSLRVIETKTPKIPFSVYIVTKKESHLSTRVRVFRNSLIEYFTSLYPS